MSNPRSQMLGDRPLLDASEDRFGYQAFAKMLATSALKGIPANGLVVGLYGAWGLGKSSLLNLVEHEVNQDPAEPVVVVRFNPWWFSGREDLTRRFFTELEHAAFGKGLKVGDIVNKFKQYSDAIAPVAVAATANPFVGMGLKLASALTPTIAATGILALKRDLHDALAENAFRILVLIDDIDRLLPDEMLEVFRLAKSVGDLPNVIYVLAFDYEATTELLDTKLGDGLGRRYLEKIVQVPFDLPTPRRSALSLFLADGLRGLFQPVAEDLIEHHRLRQLLSEVIEPLLKTPRDVVRLLNALSVTFPVVANEVNAVDFLGLEMIRLQFPNVYRMIRRESNHFVGVTIAARQSIERLRRDEGAFHQNWLASLDKDRSHMEALVRILFPGLIGSEYRPTNLAALRRTRRICTEEHFQKYFQYGLEADELSLQAFRAILAQTETEALSSSLRELQSKEHRFREFLEMLGDELKAQGSISSPANMIAALCAVGDEILAGHNVMGEEYLLPTVLADLLQRITEGERLARLLSALEQATVSLVARVMATLSMQHGRHDEGAAPAERALVSAADVDSLEAVALLRVRAAAADNSLAKAAWLKRVVYAWQVLSTVDEVRMWLSTVTQNDPTLVRVLSGLVGVPSRERGLSPLLTSYFDLSLLRERVEHALNKPEWDEADIAVLEGVLSVLPEAAVSPDPITDRSNGA